MSACKKLLYLVKHRSLWTHVRRKVTTWSPVGAAFNAKPHRRLDLFEKSVVRICAIYFYLATTLLHLALQLQRKLMLIEICIKLLLWWWHSWFVWPLVYRVCLECQSWVVLQASRLPQSELSKTLSIWWKTFVTVLQGLRLLRLLTSCQMVYVRWLIW